MITNKAETDFGQWMRDRIRFCKESTKSDNTTRHFDFITDVGKVEVKDRKKVTRTSDLDDTRKLVEWQAVRYGEETGRIGWVRGSADWIVFREMGGWLWVDRKELLNLVSRVPWEDFTTKDGRYLENFRAYRRSDFLSDRDDLFCYVPRTDIMVLPSTFYVDNEMR